MVQEMQTECGLISHMHAHYIQAIHMDKPSETDLLLNFVSVFFFRIHAESNSPIRITKQYHNSCFKGFFHLPLFLDEKERRTHK